MKLPPRIVSEIRRKEWEDQQRIERELKERQDKEFKDLTSEEINQIEKKYKNIIN